MFAHYLTETAAHTIADDRGSHRACRDEPGAKRRTLFVEISQNHKLAEFDAALFPDAIKFGWMGQSPGFGKGERFT